MVFKIAVVGAGINGLACSVKIKEKYKDIQVVLISDNFTPNTTGDGSGGLWYPYLCGKTPEHLLAKWGGESYNFLHKLWLEGGHDVCLMPIFDLYKKNNDLCRPGWADIVFGYQILEKKQLEYLNRLYSEDYTVGHTFTTFIIPPTSFLEYLYQRFKNSNGQVVQANVTSLRDTILDDYHVVVNCTGMGARLLVPDHTMFAIRGQISKVTAPWINETVIDEDGGNYLIPNAKTCVLGGTHQEHNYNTNVDDKDKDFILNGCKHMIPGLKYAEILNHWAGLRPGRDQIRLESEEENGKLYIHNYGHGGSGLTLFWGCATDVLQILEKYIKSKNILTKSKI